MIPTHDFELRPEEDVLHGIHVPDPYRWLEDRSLPATEQWIRGQAQRCREYFDGCPALSEIRSRVETSLNVTVIDQPVRIGTRYFYRRRAKGEEQASIYVHDVAAKREEVLVTAPKDPFASVKIHRVSPTGKLLAYELRYGGTDRRTIHVLDVERGIDLDTDVEADWFRGLVLNEIERGFFYCRDTDSVHKEHTVRWHAFDTLSRDSICFRVPLTPLSRLLLTSDDVHVGLIHIYRDGPDDVLDLWVAKLEDDFPKCWQHVFRRQRLPFFPVLSKGRIFAKTLACTGNGRYAEFDCNGRELQIAIPEMPGLLRQVMLVRDGFVVQRFYERKNEIRWWSLDGEDRGVVNLPKDRTATLLPTLAGAQDSLFLRCESFASAPSIYEFSAIDRTTQLWQASSETQDVGKLEVLDSSYVSADGTMVPITVVSKDRKEQRRPATCVMTAYGGFGVPGMPQFSVLVNILLEFGATFALPHIRGGGDFGAAWHEAGRRRRRQTSIEDFLVAGDWLKASGFASVDGLAIFGGSNSGLLVGAALVQRPELFRAAICIAPLLDMVRYERFDRASRWQPEYGTITDEEDFLALYSYSPYHQVKERVNYPATLFVTGDSDDRCNPAHVRKMAAALQNREAQLAPVLVDYSEARGHTPVLPLSMRIEALTRRIAFLCRELGLEFS